MRRKLIYALLSCIAAIGLAFTGLAANAAVTGHRVITSQGAQTDYSTHSNGHMDTTNVGGNATFSSPNGPVWAIDNLVENWKVKACSAVTACDSADGANYYVTMTTGKNSLFVEFANPGPNDPADGITSTCTANPPGGRLVGTGKITGTISYSVVSDHGPDLSSVPGTEPPNTGLGAVLSQIFDNATNFATVGATPYDFKYANVCGSVYEQRG